MLPVFLVDTWIDRQRFRIPRIADFGMREKCLDDLCMAISIGPSHRVLPISGGIHFKVRK